MDPGTLKAHLDGQRPDRAGVDRLVRELLDSPQSVKVLLEAIGQGGNNGHFVACWVLDHLLRKRLEYLLPHGEEFTLLLGQQQNESCIRCLAHCSEMLCIAAFARNKDHFRESIDPRQWDRILTFCFDILLSPMGMAPKVFAMSCLYYLGLKFPWAHPELKEILEASYAQGSIGYRNRAKKTLDMLARTSF